MPGLGEFRMPFAVHRGQRIHYTVEGEGPLVVLQHGLLTATLRNLPTVDIFSTFAGLPSGVVRVAGE